MTDVVTVTQFSAGVTSGRLFPFIVSLKPVVFTQCCVSSHFAFFYSFYAAGVLDLSWM